MSMQSYCFWAPNVQICDILIVVAIVTSKAP